MLTSRLAPRACRRFLQHHRSRISTRHHATEIEANEAAFEQQLRQAASLEQDPVHGQNDSVQTTPQPPRRRRRRKDASPQRDLVLDAYYAHQHMQKTTAPYGSNFIPGYQPHTLLSNPPRPADVTLELLMASQAHMGHSTSLWNPANSRYIFGVRDGIHIISLDTTAQYLRRAAKVVSGVAERGGLILFVGTRPGFDRCVVRAAQLSSPACHLFERWVPGSITNAQQILGRCQMRVVDEFDAEVDGFEDQLFDRSALKPDLVICLNPLENRPLLHECALATIPTIGIIDTDADPTQVTYPIPANDDSIRAVQVIAGVLGRAGQEGQNRRRAAAVHGRITYNPARRLNLPDDFDIPTFQRTRIAKKRAIQTGAADIRALQDPSLASAMASLSDGEKRLLADGDDSLFQFVEHRLNPQERSALRRQFGLQAALQALMPVESENLEQEDDEGDVWAGKDPNSNFKLQSYKDKDPDDLERRRLAAAEAYFQDPKDFKDQGGNSPQRGQGSLAAEAQDPQEPNIDDFMTSLRRKLSPTDFDVIRSGPSEQDLRRIQSKVSAEEFNSIISALRGESSQEAEEVAEAADAEGEMEAGPDAETPRNYFSDDYDVGDYPEVQQEQEAEDRMGVNEGEERILSEKEAEREGLGSVGDEDPQGGRSDR